jgi:hypothetical protein
MGFIKQVLTALTILLLPAVVAAVGTLAAVVALVDYWQQVCHCLLNRLIQLLSAAQASAAQARRPLLLAAALPRL